MVKHNQRKSLGTILATGMIGLSSLLSGCEEDSASNSSGYIQSTPTTISSPTPSPTPVKYTFNLNEGSIVKIPRKETYDYVMDTTDLDSDGDSDIVISYKTFEGRDSFFKFIFIENQTPQMNKFYQAENPQQ